MRKNNHSDYMKKLWQMGKFEHRDESYRDSKEYREKVSKTVKKRWEEGVYTSERNKKISIALKGRIPWNKGKKKVYVRNCKYCGIEFTTMVQGNVICSNKNCQKLKGYMRKISPETELLRREKIRKKMRGKIPKNLLVHIKGNNLYRQYDMYKIIKKWFPTAKYNYYVKTIKSFRILDVAISELKIDFEYNGKIHLMRSVKEHDRVRTKDLNDLGWRVVVIDRNNFGRLSEIAQNIKYGNLE